MLINVTKDKSGFHVNKAFAQNVAEFSDLIEAEGEQCMAFVVYLFDPAEDNPWSSLPKEIRVVELLDSMGYDKQIMVKEVVKKAAAKYEMFCNENTSYKLKSSYEQGMHKVAKFIGAVEALDHDTAKKFVDTLKVVPELLKGKNDLEKLGNKEMETRGKVRGKRDPTPQELRQRNANIQ